MPIRVVVTGSAIRPLMTGQPLVADNNEELGQVVSSTAGQDTAVLELPDGPEGEAILERMQRNGLGVQPTQAFYPLGQVAFAEENTMGRQFPLVGVTPEWQKRVEYGAKCVIGVADTGFPPEKARNTYFGTVLPVNAGGPEDNAGHSTGVGSIIGGSLGVLRLAKLVFATALPNGRGDDATVHNALVLLANHGVDVINASLGGGVSRHIQNAVKYCQERGIPVVAAAGNSGAHAAIGSPADTAAFVIGATTLDGTASAPFTSGGNNWEQETGAAPGMDIGLAHLDGGYGKGNGTSFAAPLMAGVIAAMKRYY